MTANCRVLLTPCSTTVSEHLPTVVNPLETSPEPEPEEADDGPTKVEPPITPSRLRRRTVVETPQTSSEPEVQGQVVSTFSVLPFLIYSPLGATAFLKKARSRIPNLNTLAHPRLRWDLPLKRTPKLPGRINARCSKRWLRLDPRNVDCNFV